MIFFNRMDYDWYQCLSALIPARKAYGVTWDSVRREMIFKLQRLMLKCESRQDCVSTMANALMLNWLSEEGKSFVRSRPPKEDIDWIRPLQNGMHARGNRPIDLHHMREHRMIDVENPTWVTETIIMGMEREDMLRPRTNLLRIVMVGGILM